MIAPTVPITTIGVDTLGAVGHTGGGVNDMVALQTTIPTPKSLADRFNQVTYLVDSNRTVRDFFV